MGGSISRQSLDVIVEAISSQIQSTLQSNVQSDNTSISLTQNQEIINEGDINCKGGINIGGNMKIASDMKVFTNFDTKTTNEIKAKIESLIDSENNQVMKIARQMFSSLFANYDDQMEMSIRNTINNYSNQYTNQSNLQKAALTVIASQDGKIINRAKLTSDEVCNLGYNQDIYIKAVADRFATNLTEAFTSSDIANTIKQRSTQKLDKKETGLAEALLAAAVLAVAIGIMYLLMGIGKAKAGGSALPGMGGKGGGGIPTMVWIILITIILYIIYAYSRKIFPFKPKTLWGAEFIPYNGDNTKLMVGDKCVEYDNNSENEGKAIYRTKSKCEEALKDPENNTFKKFFGCKYNTTEEKFEGCQQYPELWNEITDKVSVEAVYPTNAQCIDSRKCTTFWTCELDDEGYPTGVDKCIERKDVQNRGILEIPYDSEQKCKDAAKCKTTYFCASKEKKKCLPSTNQQCTDTNACPGGIYYGDKTSCLAVCKT